MSFPRDNYTKAKMTNEHALVTETYMHSQVRRPSHDKAINNHGQSKIIQQLIKAASAEAKLAIVFTDVFLVSSFSIRHTSAPTTELQELI